jgi:hypothetical protein
MSLKGRLRGVWSYIPQWKHTVVGGAFSSTDAGDTGSLIRFRDGSAVGMITASLKIMKVAYFAHTEDLCSIIRSRTGASDVQLMTSIQEQPLILLE